MNCPVCEEPASASFRDKRRSFYYCSSCSFIWAHPKSYLDEQQERLRYNLHTNTREDAGYVAFLESILNRALERWNAMYRFPGAFCSGKTEPQPRILDWGSGPQAILSELVRERGYTVYSYDPLYAPQLPPGQRSFDILFCIEVAEHFKDPVGEFLQLSSYLKPGGLLVVHTHTVPRKIFAEGEGPLQGFFSRWWYKEDPTHVSFYSENTLQILASLSGFRYEAADRDGKLHFFVRPLPVLVAGGANVDIEGRP